MLTVSPPAGAAPLSITMSDVITPPVMGLYAVRLCSVTGSTVKLVDADVATYIYENDVVLLVPLTIAADARGKVSVACSLPGSALNCNLNQHARPPTRSCRRPRRGSAGTAR